MRAQLWVLTGNQAAGKTTLGRLLALRFPKAAHVEGDDMQKLIVAGGRWPQDPARDMDAVSGALTGDAGSQYRLRIRNACLVAASFADAGIVAVLSDIICGDGWEVMSAALAGRNVHFVMLRPPVPLLRQRELERLPAEERASAVAAGRPVNLFESEVEAGIDATPRVGLWLDPSGLTPDSVVDLLLARQAEALITVHPPGGLVAVE